MSDLINELLAISLQIFQSKGELGVPRNQKRDVTLPQVSHFHEDHPRDSSELQAYYEDGHWIWLGTYTSNLKIASWLSQEFHFKTEERAQARGPPSLTDQLLKVRFSTRTSTLTCAI